MNELLQASNPAVELYEMLLQNPSIFGRLTQIAGFWDPQTSRYERGLPERLGNAGLNQAIFRWHQAFFIEWLALSLAQQQNDVEAYLARAGRTSERIQRIREAGEAAIPPLVDYAERQTFLKNLSFIQTVLTHENRTASTAA